MFDLIVNFITAYILGYYLITTLQWYNYRLKRVIFHFSNYKWHLFYFVIPIITYTVAYKFFWIYLFFGLIPALFLWSKKVESLVITNRIRRFFLFLGLIETMNLVLLDKLNYNPGISVLVVVILAVLLSEITENILFLKYKKQAKEKLNQIKPTIIGLILFNFSLLVFYILKIKYFL